MEKTIVTISRKWNNPQIEVNITKDEISLTMSMVDFVEALKREIGSITWTFRNSTFTATMDSAIQRILEGVKEESAKAI